MGDIAITRFPTDVQWNKLLDIAQNDAEIRTGQFIAPHGKQRVARKWDTISEDLNALDGANKTGPQWKDAFTNLRSRASAAYQERMKYMKGTGGGESVEEANLGLSPIYSWCMTICGTVKATGNEAVANPLEIQRRRRSVPHQNGSNPSGHSFSEFGPSGRSSSGLGPYGYSSSVFGPSGHSSSGLDPSGHSSSGYRTGNTFSDGYKPVNVRPRISNPRCGTSPSTDGFQVRLSPRSYDMPSRPPRSNRNGQIGPSSRFFDTPSTPRRCNRNDQIGLSPRSYDMRSTPSRNNTNDQVGLSPRSYDMPSTPTGGNTNARNMTEYYLNHTPPKTAKSPACKRLFKGRNIGLASLNLDEDVVILSDDLSLDVESAVAGGVQAGADGCPEGAGEILDPLAFKATPFDMSVLVQALQAMTSATKQNTDALRENSRALELATQL